MADKVNPKMTPSPEKPVVPTPPLPPPPGTYIVKVPRNQIYRVPPPENAILYQQLSRPKSSRKFLICCCCPLVFFLLLASTAAAVSYLVFLPKSPKLTINNVSIKSFNLTTITPLSIFSFSLKSSNNIASPPLASPEFDISFTAVNPNSKFGVCYQEGSSVQVSYKQVNMFEGVLPQFFQPGKNVTMFNTALQTNPAMEIMTSLVADELVAAEKTGRVPLMVILRAPVKFKWGWVKTWTMNVKVWCDVTVDKLTADSKIVLKNCDYNLYHW